jgi:hypothetical protein
MVSDFCPEGQGGVRGNLDSLVCTGMKSLNDAKHRKGEAFCNTRFDSSFPTIHVAFPHHSCCLSPPFMLPFPIT